MSDHHGRGAGGGDVCGAGGWGAAVVSDIDWLEHARTSLWAAEKALRMTLAPGIGWSLVDDIVRAQHDLTRRIDEEKAKKGKRRGKETHRD